MTTWRTRTACQIPTATNTHAEYVILIINFTLQQWLHELASMLRYMYIVSLVIISHALFLSSPFRLCLTNGIPTLRIVVRISTFQVPCLPLVTTFYQLIVFH
jgi:hypothetical protein